METDFKKIYNKEETIKYLSEAREHFGSREFMMQEERVEQLSKFLAHLYLYCPQELSEYVYGTLNELTMRDMYAIPLRMGVKNV